MDSFGVNRWQFNVISQKVWSFSEFPWAVDAHVAIEGTWYPLWNLELKLDMNIPDPDLRWSSSRISSNVECWLSEHFWRRNLASQAGLRHLSKKRRDINLIFPVIKSSSKSSRRNANTKRESICFEFTFFGGGGGGTLETKSYLHPRASINPSHSILKDNFTSSQNRVFIWKLLGRANFLITFVLGRENEFLKGSSVMKF